MSVIDDFIGVLENSQQMDIEGVLALILAKMRRQTAAEAGSIFIVRPVDGRPEELKACSLQNDKLQIESETFTIPIDRRSIAGYVADTGEILEIDDLYELGDDVPYQFNRAFDDKNGYRSQSMLAFPLKNFQGRVIGVVQLLNHITGADGEGNAAYGSFPLRHVDDMRSVMTVLGVMVERIDLLNEIETLRKEVEVLKAA